MKRIFSRLLCSLSCLLMFGFAACGQARASLIDEVQVYTDDINRAHEFGLELHVNTTPRGSKQAEYPGEVVPQGGLRITPEFSYGLSEDFEAGLYLPTSFNAGNYSLGGYKLRLKWVPLKAGAASHGFFAGANGEFSDINSKFEASRRNFELRIMSGWRSQDWLVAVNPVFGWALSSSQISPRPSSPDFGMQYKVARSVAQGVAMGFEYYNDMGALRHFDPAGQQSKILYYAIDVTRQPLPFNLGIGRGLNGSSDKWTVKAIFEIPFSL